MKFEKGDVVRLLNGDRQIYGVVAKVDIGDYYPYTISWYYERDDNLDFLTTGIYGSEEIQPDKKYFREKIIMNTLK